MPSGRVLVPALVAGLILIVLIAIYTLGGDSDSERPGERPDAPEVAERPDTADLPESPAVVAGSVTGRVLLFGAETPVVGAVVKVGPAKTETGEDGRFTLGPFEGPSLKLEVASGDLKALVTDVALAAAGTDVGDLYLGSNTVLSGVVVDENDSPVAGAAVKILERAIYDVGSWWTGPKHDQFLMGIEVIDKDGDPPGFATVTDENGHFRVEGLSPGQYFVSAVAEGKSAGEVDELKLPKGGEATARIVLGTSTTIEGKIIDIRRNPVAGARIMGALWNRAAVLPYTHFHMTTSSSDGAFRLTNLTGGQQHILFVRAPNGQIGVGIRVNSPGKDVEIQVGPRFTLIGSVVDDETGEPVEGANIYALLGHTTSDETGRYTLSGVVKSAFFRWIWITADGYEEDNHEIDLGSSILGGPVIRQDFRLSKLVPASLRVIARDPSGVPLSGVLIEALDWSSETTKGSATTSDAGEALLENIPSGGARIRATKSGYAHVDVNENSGGASLRASQWISLEPGAEGNLEITMAPSAAIRGRVRDTEGKPLAGVMLVTGQSELGETDKEGRFEIDGLPRDLPVLASFVKDGYISEFVAVTGGSSALVEVTLKRGGTLSGVVKDAEGQPAAGVRMSVRNDAGTAVTDRQESAANGSFRFEGLIPGRYTILGYRKDHAPVRTPAMKVDAGETREGIEIRLVRGAEVRITPVRQDGNAVNGRVFIYGPLEQPESERVLSRGNYRNGEPPVFRLQPGQYRIVVIPTNDDEDAGASETEMDISGSVDLDIPLAREALRITIEAKLPEGAELSGAQVRRTEPEKPTFDFWATKGPDGKLRTPSLPPGKYRVTAYWTVGADGVWNTRIFEGMEPGGKPLVMDLTK